jgi:hypothetical protein
LATGVLLLKKASQLAAIAAVPAAVGAEVELGVAAGVVAAGVVAVELGLVLEGAELPQAAAAAASRHAPRTFQVCR